MQGFFIELISSSRPQNGIVEVGLYPMKKYKGDVA
jgi:hypothetical protein